MTDVRFSLGFAVSEDWTIPDVVPESPAARAGIGPGMRLVAVNGRRWSREILREAVKASASRPIDLLVENGEDIQYVPARVFGRRAVSPAGTRRVKAGRPDEDHRAARPAVPRHS